MSGPSLKERFNALPPDKKRKLVVGGVISGILGVILLGVMATDDGPKTSGGSKKQKVEASILTGRDPNKIGIEAILANNKRQENQIEELKRQVQAISNGQTGSGRSSGGAGGVPFPTTVGGVQEVVALPGSPGAEATQGQPSVPPTKASDKALQSAVSSDPSVPIGRDGRPVRQPVQPSGQPRTAGDALPPPNIPALQDNSDVFGPGAAQSSDPSAATVSPTPKLKLRVLTPRNDQTSASPTDMGVNQNAVYTNPSQGRNLAAMGRGGANRDPEFYIPMGSILSGTLMTGVDAPGNGSTAKKDPFPALFRVKQEAILPNAGLFDLRECFIVASAYGELSSERVYMRAEGLSCQRSDGAIIEASIDAYASGPDGKAGIRGVVVEKTGQLISRSLLAGFMSGLSGSFKPQQSQQVSVNGAQGSSVPYQYPSVDYVMGTAILGGAASAANRISQIYEDLAKQVFPVIEVNAGIPIDFIMTRGATLRFKRVGDVSGSRPQPTQASGGARSGQAAENVTTSVTGALGGGFSVTPGAGTSTPARAPAGTSTAVSVGR